MIFFNTNVPDIQENQMNQTIENKHCAVNTSPSDAD